MIIFNILDNKSFMHLLLRDKLFDSFEVRNIILNTFTQFEISGVLEKSYFSLDEQEQFSRNFCLWSELKPTVFQLIKGNKQPRYLKIVLSYDNTKLSNICENAAALFLNIVFENGNIICTTGSSEKNFSLDKKVENSWDEYVSGYFKTNNIVSTH